MNLCWKWQKPEKEYQQFTSCDYAPHDYLVLKNEVNVKCSRTMFMWDSFVILSRIIQQNKFPVMDMWKALKIQVWITLFETIICLGELIIKFITGIETLMIEST